MFQPEFGQGELAKGFAAAHVLVLAIVHGIVCIDNDSNCWHDGKMGDIVISQHSLDEIGDREDVTSTEDLRFEGAAFDVLQQKWRLITFWQVFHSGVRYSVRNSATPGGKVAFCYMDQGLHCWVLHQLLSLLFVRTCRASILVDV